MSEIKIAGLLELFKQYLVVQRKASQAMFSMAELIISSCSGGNCTCMPAQQTAGSVQRDYGEGQVNTSDAFAH